MSSTDPCLWLLDDEQISSGSCTEAFTDPFRYIPDSLVRKAGKSVVSKLSEWSSMPEGSPEREIERSFAEGKMIGVLICRPSTGSIQSPSFIAAFSGTVKDSEGRVTGTVDGFVPPIIDLTDPDGYFKKEESRITLINNKIDTLCQSRELSSLKKALADAESERDRQITDLQTQIRFAKMQRDEIRCETSDPSRLEELIKESQFQKAELKRLKDRWKAEISDIASKLTAFEEEIKKLKSLRAEMSDNLQRWIFGNAVVHNGKGECSSIWNIFADKGVTPPGGTGDCAAPKLLEYAFTHNLTPLAMGEFWYGRSPDSAVRTHGHFYPSCTSKCGPLLGYMLKGLEVAEDIHDNNQSPVVIHEDESVIVVEKPGGMPSVPGLDGRQSLQEWLSATHGQEIFPVHRLDMDTSGVMVFAKTSECAVNLQRQFEEHTVKKTYKARLTGSGNGTLFKEKQSGSIELSLSPDHDERPRQKVDFVQGKAAFTEYETASMNPDGSTDILLYPHTGRTHQLRVHCAHTLGLASPIVGDLLYGSYSIDMTPPEFNRLCLHALSITFRHPLTGNEMTFTSDRLSY